MPSAESAARSAYLELQRLQLREQELWEKRGDASLAGPAVGIGVLAPSFLVLVPIGSILLADARNSVTTYGTYGGYYEADSVDRETQRVGRILVSLGITAMAAVGLFGWRIRQVRRHRATFERELRAVSVTRTALENVLGSVLTPAVQMAPR